MSGVVPGAVLPLKLALQRFHAESDAKLTAAADARPAAAATTTRAPAGAQSAASAAALRVAAEAAQAPQARVAQTSAEPSPEGANAAPKAPPATAETLSAAGRMMARLAPLPLGEAERGRALEQAVLTQIARPAAADAHAVAGELRGSLERSGLFYEAHLRAWDSGEFALEDLRREPQARIGPRVAARETVDAFAQTRAAAGSPHARDAAPQAALPVPRELQRLVREQLATLETRTAVVPLALWPGQQASLAITDEPEARQHAPDEPPPEGRQWRATLRIDLPRLGEIEFSLSVHDERVTVGARTHRAESQAQLAAQAQDLQGALGRNALLLERLEVAGDAH
jgi:hypothetical protein